VRTLRYCYTIQSYVVVHSCRCLRLIYRETWGFQISLPWLSDSKARQGQIAQYDIHNGISH